MITKVLDLIVPITKQFQYYNSLEQEALSLFHYSHKAKTGEECGMEINGMETIILQINQDIDNIQKHKKFITLKSSLLKIFKEILYKYED